MNPTLRTVLFTAGAFTLVAACLAAPSIYPAQAAAAVAPVQATLAEMFPPPFDPKALVKYDVDLGPSISSQPLTSEQVEKISYGHRSRVYVVTTSSGTYSTDALTSPNVRYPGVDVALKDDEQPRWHVLAFSSPHGRGFVTTWSSGSFTYIDSSWTPAQRR